MCTPSQSFENTRALFAERFSVGNALPPPEVFWERSPFADSIYEFFFLPPLPPLPGQDIRGTVHVVMNSDHGIAVICEHSRMRIFLLADRQDKDTPDRGRLILVWIMEKQNLVTLVNVISQSFVFRGRVSSKLIFIIAYYVIAFCAPISAIFCSQRAVLIPFFPLPPSLSLSFHFFFPVHTTPR